MRSKKLTIIILIITGIIFLLFSYIIQAQTTDGSTKPYQEPIHKKKDFHQLSNNIGYNEPQNKPNIIMLLVDDYGWRDSQVYGSLFYETPHIDKLASEGVRFIQAYATYPRCVPSRYSIMTGSHPARLKGDGEGRDGELGFSINKPNVSIGEAMKNAGYYTFYLGKWHLGGEDYAPMGVGFDKAIAAGQAGATSSHFAPYNLSKGKGSGKEKPVLDLDNAPEGECLEDRLTEEAIKMLKERDISKPFFGILAHYAVHTPIEGKEEYVNYFNQKLKTIKTADGPNYEKESAGETKLKQDNAKYAAMIKSVDESVGKILKYLEQTGLSRNTIVVLTSDHGGLASRGNNRELATSNKPLRAGKGHLYEGGIRVPLIVKWPGITKAGTVSNSIIQGIDFFPTFLDIAGVKFSASQIADGTSFLNILKKEINNTDRTLYWHNGAPRPTQTADIYSSAIRSGEYKLIDFFGLQKQELYNLKTDLGEQNNIADQKPELVKALFEKLVIWRKKMGADMRLKPGSMSEEEKQKNQGILLNEDAKKNNLGKKG